MKGVILLGLVAVLSGILVTATLSSALTLLLVGSLIDSEITGLQERFSGLAVYCGQEYREQAAIIKWEETVLYCTISQKQPKYNLEELEVNWDANG